jgi:hypothetical protein
MPAQPTRRAPDPERKVTLTLTDENTLVVDTLGRANGIDGDGRVVRQTPGATVEKVGGNLVVTLPDIPDGLAQALATRPASTGVDVTAVVQERGSGSRTVRQTATLDASGQFRLQLPIGNAAPDTSTPTRTPDAPRPSPAPQPSAPQPSPRPTGMPALPFESPPPRPS